MDSHGSVASAEMPVPAAEPGSPTSSSNGALNEPHRSFTGVDAALAIAVAAVLATVAFVGNGGLRIGPVTLVEVIAIVIGALLVAAAVLLVGFDARVHGGVALVGLAGLAAVTSLSIIWSLFPSDSWLEANRTVSYVAVFAAGIAAVRLARDRWAAVLIGVLGALTVICLYGLATKVAPGLLASDETYARLREPFGYWNAVGVTAAMGAPLCMWLGTREQGRDQLAALAWPALGLFFVTILMSYSRGSILAVAVGIALWFAFVPRRLQSLFLLLPALAISAIVAAWAFSQSALSDDRIALSDREGSGVAFGVILVVGLAVLFACGLAIVHRARTRPPSQQAHRRAAIAALVVAALIPLVSLAALASTDRGVTGTISDRWHDLTHEQGTPSNDPGRLTETGSVRTIYYGRALNVWRQHRFEGAGAGAFDKAQLRYRDNAAQGRHAHGYVHQTLADLGLLGLGVSLIALIAWLVAASAPTGLRRGRFRTPWGPERTGMAALALVAIVFGVHSAIDWTWFVPAVAMTGFFAAGWVAGRGPIGVEAVAGKAGVPPLDQIHGPSMPARPIFWRRLPVIVGVLAAGLLASLVVIQPWRANRAGEDALKLATAGDYAAARQSAEDAKDINPLSSEPYFDLAAIETAAGNNDAALKSLQLAVQREPANPDSWRRLGDFYLRILNQPDRAVPVLRGAVYLDPYSPATRSSLLQALRAEQIQRQVAEARAVARQVRRQLQKQAAAGGTPAATP